MKKDFPIRGGGRTPLFNHPAFGGLRSSSCAFWRPFGPILVAKFPLPGMLDLFGPYLDPIWASRVRFPLFEFWRSKSLVFSHGPLAGRPNKSGNVLERSPSLKCVQTWSKTDKSVSKLAQKGSKGAKTVQKVSKRVKRCKNGPMRG